MQCIVKHPQQKGRKVKGIYIKIILFIVALFDDSQYKIKKEKAITSSHIFFIFYAREIYLPRPSPFFFSLYFTTLLSVCVCGVICESLQHTYMLIDFLVSVSPMIESKQS